MSLTSQPLSLAIRFLQVNAPAAVSIHLVALDQAPSVVVNAPKNFSVSLEERESRLIVRIGNDQSGGPITQTGRGAIAAGPGSVAAGAGGIAIRGTVAGSISPDRIPAAESDKATITFPSNLEVFFTFENTSYTTEGNVRLA